MGTFRLNGTGSTYRRKTLSSGTFACSNERCKSRRRGEQAQQYRLREERKWISLLWIPIAPVGQRGQYVECATCKTVHPPSSVGQHEMSFQPPAGAVPARWGDDPTGRHGLRYWDGQRWTEHVADGTTQGIDPV